MSLADDEAWMQRALALAEQGRGFTSPNPVVGCVLVKDGSLLSAGFHARCGEAHAEVHALRSVEKSALGATAYVTLEPCNHHGRTPPCVEALLAAGVAEVVIGTRDPNPKASGGLERLRASGILVRSGILEQKCRRQNAAFFKFQRTQQPLVTAKWAMTLDGKIATQSGDSKWITSPDARRLAHRLRAQNDVVMAGIGTVLRDNPQLNVRMDRELDAWNGWQPWRVILDSQARLPLDGALWSNVNLGEVRNPETLKLLVAVAKGAEPSRLDALRERGAEVLELEPNAQGKVSLGHLMTALAQRGHLSVFVEGGSHILGACLKEGLIDRWHAFVAPRILGGTHGLPPFSGQDPLEMRLSANGTFEQVERCGPDLCITGQLGAWPWLAVDAGQ
jgi:diaminohydroxyphosphoribosylaminopyrimidine deaminase/5-amino-6-(5-phosphoribosylamino)uracil reductase